MKEHNHKKNIGLAFMLNLLFSILETFGGVITGSIAILSDAIHDFGDALSIGTAYFLEHISDKDADEKYTLGYKRFSILGAIITSVILCIGSILMLIQAIYRLYNPIEINYNGMIIIAIIGLIINGFSVYKTSNHHDHLNEKSINLHLLEDLLGWIVVLIGSIIMRFSDLAFLDSVMTIGISLFIGFHAIKNLLSGFSIFLGKTPSSVKINDIENRIKKFTQVQEVKSIKIIQQSEEDIICIIKVKVWADETINNIFSFKEHVIERIKELGINQVYVDIVEGMDYSA